MKLFIFKFYGEKIEIKNFSSGFYISILPNQNHELYLCRKEVTIRLPHSLVEFNFFEIIFDVSTKTICDIRGLDIPIIKPEILKLANETNDNQLHEYSEYLKKKEHVGLTKNQTQDVLDRSIFYGKEFDDQLLSLLDKFPLKIEWVKASEDDAALTHRKVSKIS